MKKMTNKQFIKKLKSLDACEDAVAWVGKKSLKTAWAKCERADWMLWLAFELELATYKERIHIVCDCAALSLKYVPKGEARPRLAIEAARKCADNPTQENKDAASEAAEAAAWAAAWVAEAAARAAVWAAEAAWVAAEAAWVAAEAAARVARVARAARAAERETHKKMCKMIRSKIKLEKGE